MSQEEFEKELIDFILKGDDPVLEGLRNQYRNSHIEPAKLTGAGFLTHFRVEPKIAPVADGRSFEINDVHADLGNIPEAFGFMLVIEKGYLSYLEGYTYSFDNWPNEYSHVTLVYNGLEDKRDFEKLRKAWS